MYAYTPENWQYIMVAIFKKRNFLMFLVAGVFTLSTSLVGCSSQTTDKSAVASSNIKTKVLRMGYQSAGDIVKVKGVLEKRLTPLGISVEWSKFAAGPQLLEAMNVGSVDFGSVGRNSTYFCSSLWCSFRLCC